MRPIQISPNIQRHFKSPSLHTETQITHLNPNLLTLVSPSKHSKIIQRKSQLLNNVKTTPKIFSKKVNGKENCSPITIQQKESAKPSHKKNFSNFDPPITHNIHINRFPCDKTNQQVPQEPAPLRQCRSRHSLIDNYCSKMTTSVFAEEGPEPAPVYIPKITLSAFKKIKFLGRGKFGEVNLMIHQETGFICAVKTIEKRIIREEKLIKQLAKEIKIHHTMKHLNIIGFYGFFDDQFNLYMILEYSCEGSLYSKLKGKNRLEEQEIKPIVRHVCEGVRFIHRMGFIHRDLKPENIVMQFNVPKICDFGWSAGCFESEMRSSYCGTPLYLAPEMVKKQKYNRSIDIWSIGLLTYELLVGRAPFGVWSQNDLERIIKNELSFPDYIDRTEKCESFIRQCLEKEAQKRLESEDLMRQEFIVEIKYHNLEFEFFDHYARLFNIY